jgi:phosphatidylglycerol:prolipoprotein diacylglycerol transferase
MITYPEINPVLLSLGPFEVFSHTLGPLKIHWYGVMYLIGFLGGWWLGRIRAAKPHSPWTPPQVDDIVFFIVLGVVLGGRIGYVLFYGFSDFLANPEDDHTKSAFADDIRGKTDQFALRFRKPG